MRLGGLGIKDPIVLQPVARIAACLSFLQRGRQLCFPEETLRVPNDWKTNVSVLHHVLGANFEPLNACLPLEPPTGIDSEHRSQRWWSNHL